MTKNITNLKSISTSKAEAEIVKKLAIKLLESDPQKSNGDLSCEKVTGLRS